MNDDTRSPAAGAALDPIDAWLNLLDGTADQIEDIGHRVGAGEYSREDVKADLETSMARMLEWSYALEVWFLHPKPLPPIDPTKFVMEMKVFEHVTERPLELTTNGFRLVGDGEAIRIKPEQVSFEPTTLGDGDDTFVVTVERGAADHGIYSGEVTSTTGEPVTDTVMPTW